MHNRMCAKFVVHMFFILLFGKDVLNWSKMTEEKKNVVKKLLYTHIIFFSNKYNHLVHQWITGKKLAF